MPRRNLTNLRVGVVSECGTSVKTHGKHSEVARLTARGWARPWQAHVVWPSPKRGFFRRQFSLTLYNNLLLLSSWQYT